MIKRKVSQVRNSIAANHHPQRSSKSRQRSLSQTKTSHNQKSNKKSTTGQGQKSGNKKSQRHHKQSHNESIDLTYLKSYKQNLDMFSIPPRQRKSETHDDYQNNVLSYTEDDDYQVNKTSKSNRKNSSKRMPYNSSEFKRNSASRCGEKDAPNQAMEYTQHEIIEAKSQICEQRIQINDLKKKLKEFYQQAQEYKDKFKQEQQKSDEFFTKAEKYKVIAKDYRRDVEKLKQENQNYKNDYETLESYLKTKEQQESRCLKDRQFIMQEILISLKQLQKGAQMIDKQGQLILPINQIFESVKALNHIELESSQQLPTKMNTDGSLSQELHNLHYIGDSLPNSSTHLNKKNFKVSQDAIIYNSETLGTNEDRFSNNETTTGANTSCGRNQVHLQPQILSYTQNTQSQSIQHNGHHENFSISENISQNNSQREDSTNQQQLEILLKIQEEMNKIKEDSSQVLQENQYLKEKNNNLAQELDNERSRIESSLLPQYKEAFEQLRKQNEIMQKKIEDLEDQRSKNPQQLNLSKSVKEDLQDLKLKVSKFEYENANLKDERELFVQQIQNLENYNKNQEKMITYFQSGLLNAAYQTQQVPPNGQQESFDLQNYLNLKLKSSTQNLNNPTAYSKTRMLENSQIDDGTSSEISKSQPYQTYRSGENFGMNSFNAGQNKPLEQRNGVPQMKNSSLTLGNSNHNKASYKHSGTDTSLYIDTVPNDKSDILLQNGENEHLFSLSSTQPENHLKLSSPGNGFIAPRHIDFNQQQLINSAIGKETFGGGLTATHCNNNNVVMISQFPKTSTSQSYKKSHQITTDHINLQDHSQGQFSQEVTNRDKSILKSGNNSQISQSNQQLLYQIKSESYQMNDQSFSENDSAKDIDDNMSSSQSRAGGQTPSGLPSDRSLEQHIKMLRQTHKQNFNQLQSQETFQAKSHLQSKDGQSNPSKATTNKNSQRNKFNQYVILNDMNNKENQENYDENSNYMMQTENSKRGGHNNHKIKSPAFMEQPSMQNSINSDTTDNINQQYASGSAALDSTTQMRQMEQQIMKQSYLNTGTLSQNTHNGSNHSNFMSERTMNLKKEITSLDEEILMLQNSLKQALLKKSDN